MAILADRWRGGLSGSNDAKPAGGRGFSVRLLSSAGRLEGPGRAAGRTIRHFLAGRAYRVAMRVLAVLLGVFALLLFREGLKRLAVI